MNKDSPPPTAALPCCDREVFSRVWARASTHDRNTSPIEVLPPSLRLPSAVSLPIPGADRPAPFPRIGQAGSDRDSILREQIRRELEERQVYQFLSSRCAGVAAGILAAMAADELRHARRLSAACFLLSGQRFFPHLPRPALSAESFWSRIRQRFWAEQRAAAAYTAAAGETSEPCLAELYRELAAEETAHADRLRALVEKMPMG